MCEAGKCQIQVVPLASLMTSNIEQNSITEQESSNSTKIRNVTKPDDHSLDNHIFFTPTSSKVHCLQKEDNSKENLNNLNQMYYAANGDMVPLFPSNTLVSNEGSVKKEQLTHDTKLYHTNTPPYTPATVHCENCLLKFEKVVELIVHSKMCEMRNNACAMILPKCISCLQQFPSLEALNVHVSQCSKRGDIYACPDCGDPFWTKHEFQAHFRSYCRRERRNRWE
ncbi:uncharacterized protein LOC109862067 [Pseudomyrmex gracilis]|uniref:uncharacterized protein LOC109862067 n=1 Tax=Pseudomyrmex gracilis TaxID=219809 RepID=UPI0009956E9A|nr:uncharacterized protein LOC109862067 [Pseudomyrmex gracilis]